MLHRYILWLALWGLPSLTDAQTRYFVDLNASGQLNGQSWADAFIDLHDALALAVSGDEVWVAAGTYFPSATNDRSARFQLSSGVRLYGGFSGTEMTPEERQIDQHPSMLSGDIGVAGDSLDNSHTLLYLFRPEMGTEVDGFVFRHGQADHQSLPNARPGTSGAALFVDGADGVAYPTVRNCVFEHNTSRSNGGAVYLDGSGTGSVAGVFSNCRFYRNHSYFGSGGGLYRNGGSWVERPRDFEQCEFVENRASRSGGGLYLNDSERSDTAQVLGCHFDGNSAGVFSDGLAWGYSRSSGSHLSVKASLFEGHGQNGALMMDLLAPDLASSVFHAEIDSCLFRNNHVAVGSGRGVVGGAMLSGDSRWTLSNTAFRDNQGTCFFSEETDRGGPHLFQNVAFDGNIGNLLIAFSSSFVGKNLRIHDNSAICFTYLNGIPGVPYHKSFHLSNSSVFNNAMGQFTNFRGTDSTSYNACTFSNNRTSGGKPVSKTYCFNNVMFNNRGNPNNRINWAFLYGKDDTLFVYNSSIDTVLPAFPTHYFNPASLFSTDPLFADYQAGDLNLLPCSPLINAGSNAAALGILTDIAGNPRILEGTVDIGAYEAPAFALSSVPQVSPACTGTSNGSVSIAPQHGCEPLSYAWSPNAGNGPELNGLPPGAFIFTVTDGSGRQITDTVTVPEAPVPSLSLAVQDITCGTHAGGTLSASVTGGTAPFGYEWSAGLGDLPQHSGLGPGPYALTVADANGCLDSASATLALVGNLTLSVGAVPISCHGEADAELTVLPANGAPPFDWNWQGWPGNAPTASPLGPGLYAVTVTDALGCTSAFSFNPVNAPAPLLLGAEGSPQTQSSPPNGAAVVTTTSGGTQPYGYLWHMGEMGHALGGLTAGTYTVTVTDARGCTASAEVVVELMLSETGEPLGVVLMYPNPAADWVRAILPEGRSGAWRLELSDASGRVVRSLACADSDCVLDLSGLAKGAYVLTARSGERVLVGRVVKQ